VLTQVLRLNTLEPVLFKMNEIRRLQQNDPAIVRPSYEHNLGEFSSHLIVTGGTAFMVIL